MTDRKSKITGSSVANNAKELARHFLGDYAPEALQERFETLFRDLSPRALSFFQKRNEKLSEIFEDGFPIISSVYPTRFYESLRWLGRNVDKLGLNHNIELDPLSKVLRGNSAELNKGSGKLGIITSLFELGLEALAVNWLDGKIDSISDVEAPQESGDISNALTPAKLSFSVPNEFSWRSIKFGIRVMPQPDYAEGAAILKDDVCDPSKRGYEILKFLRSRTNSDLWSAFSKHYEPIIGFEDNEMTLQFRRRHPDSATSPELPLILDCYPFNILTIPLTMPILGKEGNFILPENPFNPEVEHLGLEIADLVVRNKDGQTTAVTVHRTSGSIYGAGSCYQTELLALQKQIDKGNIDKALVIVEGRVHPSLIHWLNPSPEATTKSPTPDVTVVLALPLPSGKIFPLILHQSENLTSEIQLPKLKITGSDDQLVIRGVQNAINQGKLLNLLMNMPPNTRDNNYQPEQIPSINEYINFDADRISYLHEQLITYGINARKLQESSPGSTKKEPERELIETIVVSLISEMQKQPSNQKKLSLKIDDENFIDSVVDLAFERAMKIYKIESERKKQEETVGTEAHSYRVARRSFGYHGAPKVGIPLVLETIASDALECILSDGKRHDYDPALPPRTSHHDFENYLIGAPHVIEITVGSSIKRITNNDPIKANIDALDYATHQLLEDQKIASALFTNITRALRSIRDSIPKLTGDPQEMLQIKGILSELNENGTYRIPDYVRENILKKISLSGDISSLIQEWLDLYENASNQDRKLREIQDQMRKMSKSDRKIFRNNTDPEGQHRLYEDTVIFAKAVIARSHNFRDLADWCSYSLDNIQSIRASRSQKMIFIIGPDNEPRMIEEYRRQQSDYNHPKIAGGLNIYGGGEICFTQYDETFNGVDSWIQNSLLDFDSIPNSLINQPWVLKLVTNGSGHYKPSSLTNILSASCLSWFITRYNKGRATNIVEIPIQGVRTSDNFSIGIQLPLFDFE